MGIIRWIAICQCLALMPLICNCICLWCHRSHNIQISHFRAWLIHPKMKIWCLSAYPQGIQDVGDFVSSVKHKQWFLTPLQFVSHIMSVNGTHGFESQKYIHRQNQIKPCGSWQIHWGLKTRNNRSVQETEHYLYHLLPLIHRNVQLSWSQQPACDAWMCSGIVEACAEAIFFFFFLLYADL